MISIPHAKAGHAHAHQGIRVAAAIAMRPVDRASLTRPTRRMRAIIAASDARE
jgi:hypothetical protein